jgi:hypothetical protein
MEYLEMFMVEIGKYRYNTDTHYMESSILPRLGMDEIRNCYGINELIMLIKNKLRNPDDITSIIGRKEFWKARLDSIKNK